MTAVLTRQPASRPGGEGPARPDAQPSAPRRPDTRLEAPRYRAAGPGVLSQPDAGPGSPRWPVAGIGVLRRCGTRALGMLATATVVAAVAIFGLLAVGPHLFGYRTITMLTGSMSPTIQPGAVVVDTPEPVRDLRVGQIVTYHIPVLDHHVESHRVASVVRHADGTVSFTTKGDANPGADPWVATVSAHATMWRVRQVVPHAGSVLRTLRRPVVGTVLRWGGLSAVVAAVLTVIWRRPRTTDPGATEDAPASDDRPLSL